MIWSEVQNDSLFDSLNIQIFKYSHLVGPLTGNNTCFKYNVYEMKDQEVNEI